MKLQTQKNPCIGYSRQPISTCNSGVISPTMKLNSQLVAVDMDTPFARTAKGMIYASR